MLHLFIIHQFIVKSFLKIRLELNRRTFFLLYFIFQPLSWELNIDRIYSMQCFREENVAQKIAFIPTDHGRNLFHMQNICCRYVYTSW